MRTGRYCQTAEMQALLTKLGKLEGGGVRSSLRRRSDPRSRRRRSPSLNVRRKPARTRELKAFAEKTLPTLKEHLSMVRDLKTKLAKGGTN